MKHVLIYLIPMALVACSGNPTDNTAITVTTIKLKDLNDEIIDLSQYKGKAVFINFWATWCKPCIQEMPTLASLQEKIKKDSVVFLFASNEETNEIEAFAKKHMYPFRYVQVENLEALNIQALPTTFIFNAEGDLKFSESGIRVWDAPENIELITKIMAEHD